jgi:hypothetical protein
MPSKESVRSVEERLELPELSAPRIRSERDDGAVVTVLKVGFLAVSQEDCRKAGVTAPVVTGGKCFLPTAVVDLEASPLLHRFRRSMVILSLAGTSSGQPARSYATGLRSGLRC